MYRVARRVVALLLACACSMSLPAAAQGGAPRFDIFEYVIEGNSLLSDLEIERVVSPYFGEQRSLGEVEAARAALERAYQDAGYSTVVVSIPEQQVDDGVIVLSVLEGKVERLRVKGAEYSLSSDVKARLPELAEGNVPYFPDVQRQLDALNRAADVKATPVLKAGRLPGTVDVTLNVDDQLPLHGSIELTNRSTAFTEPLRLSASVRYDNLWQARHSVNVTAQTSPQATDQVKVLAATYVMPLDAVGGSLVGYVVRSNSSVPSFPTGVLGNSRTLGLRYAMPLRSLADYTHSISVGADRKAVFQSLVVGGPGGLTTSTPDITYTPLVATYNGMWLRQGGSTAIEATSTMGVRGFLGNNEDSFAAKRSGASADFFYVRGGVKQTLNVSRWNLTGKVDVQAASGPLVPNEQYAAGGADTVRGYKESERLGDDAVRIALEARAPSWRLGPEGTDLRLTILGFFEGARLRVRQPLFPQPGSYVIRGAGFGLRLSGPRGLSFDVDLARALVDAQVTKAGDHRLHARLAWEY